MDFYGISVKVPQLHTVDIDAMTSDEVSKAWSEYSLNGTKKIVAGDLKGNFFYGTDLEGDQEVFDLWYSKDNQEFRLAIKFNAGVQVAFPDQVVVKTIA